MVKVLQDGQFGDNFSLWKQEVTCMGRHRAPALGGGCGAKLEVCYSDLQLAKFRGGHFFDYYCVAKCPQCGTFTRVANMPKQLFTSLNTPANQKKAVSTGLDERV